MQYTVFLTGQANKRWRASVPALPDCEVEAGSRDEALEKIQERIQAVVERVEVLRVEVAATPRVNGAFSETPWEWFGVFQGDLSWGSLFDEIERERDKSMHL
jgi:predicted RNase H-like HicB family nuclease